MIRVLRSRQEPPALTAARGTQLPAVRAIAQLRAPAHDDFTGYREAKPALESVMGAKCWYCEKRFEGKSEPVEHYRPKTLARRGAGFASHGYWWLAWTWDNLMFICDDCNTMKGTHFPLHPSSVALTAEAQPPGGETPLLIDPCTMDPLDHIVFEVHQGRWRPRPTTVMGQHTIERLGLDGTNRPGVIDLYRDHVNDHVRPRVTKLREVMETRDPQAIHNAWDTVCRKLLRRQSIYAALSHDALNVLVSPAERTAWNLVLPRPPWPE